MIISCNNCNKKFDIDSKLIPEKGRLLQCNSCNHKWFFKKENLNKPIEPTVPVKIAIPIKKIEPIKENLEPQKIENRKNMEFLDKQNEEKFLSKTPSITENNNLDMGLKNKSKKYNILGLTIVFIISFIALIVVLDTFQSPISKIVPNIEFLLYSLYETINDVMLFLKDLI